MVPATPFDPTFDGLELVSEHGCFGGVQRFYRHASREIGLPMRFALFLPTQALAGEAVPLLTFLAGLTCTEETFAMKAGAQRSAAAHGLALLMPDTSPRGAGVAGEAAHWDFGVGAGFYLDATQPPWAGHWRMESYLLRELIPAVAAQFGLDGRRLGLSGHSMGGHGALTLALRHPGRFASVSAFAPICAPTQCPWGHKAFTGYLGQDKSTWGDHDASVLMARQDGAPYPEGILIDQGLADKFLAEQLHPEAFEAVCASVGQPLTLRRHTGHDHGYYFIASVVDDHVAHHARALRAPST
jgi:S-formylglutathione hydrolase